MALDLGELVGFLKLDDSGFDSVLDKLPEKVRGKAALMVGAGAIVGGALMAALIQGVNDAMSFEATNAKVTASLGMLPAEAARVGTLAGELYSANYGESMEQAQSAIAGVITGIEGMRTASDSSVEAMTARVLNYASAFELDVADSIAQVQQLLDSGLATSAEEAMDLMTSAMQKVPEALRGDMRDAINEYGPFLGELGLSGAEAFDMLLQGAERGTYGIDKAGDAMKELTIRGTDMSALSVGAYESMGLSAEDMAARLLAGGDTARGALDDIVGGLLAMKDPTEQANTAIALFGTPLEDLGVAQIPTFLASLQGLGGGMSDAKGAAEAMDAALFATGENGVATFQRQSELLFAELGENLLPILTDVFTFLNENPAVLQAVVVALGFLALAFAGITVATWAMNTALLANPMTWVILGIVALIAALVLLVANWEQVVDWVSDVWGGFMGWLTDGLDAFAQWWDEIWGGVGDFFTTKWREITTFVANLISAFVLGFRLIFSGVASFFRDLWSGVSSFFSGLWTNLVAGVRAIILGYISFFMGAWRGVSSFFSDLWNGLSRGVKTTWDGIIGFFRSIPSTILGFFSGIGSWLFNAGKDLISGLLNGIRSLAGTIGSFFLNLLPDWIVGPFKAALGIASPSKLFGSFGRDTVRGYLNEIERMKPEVSTTLGELVDAPELALAARAVSSSGASSSNASSSSTRVVNYYAAEHQSLSAEEALFEALGSPRVGD